MPCINMYVNAQSIENIVIMDRIFRVQFIYITTKLLIYLNIAHAYFTYKIELKLMKTIILIIYSFDGNIYFILENY